jgi:hypothetical protein
MLVQHMKCILLVMFHALSFHAGPKSDITNLKKNQKNVKPLRGVILCDLDVERKFKP